MANESELDRLSELSRHYDTLLWAVTSLWAAAIGGLLTYCWQNFDWRLGVFGIVLTVFAMYFAASFRVLRRRVHGRMTAEVRELHEAGFPIRQWDLFALVFLGLLILWVWTPIGKGSVHRTRWISGGVVASVFLAVIWVWGRWGVTWLWGRKR
jgi:hypothetical protein